MAQRLRQIPSFPLREARPQEAGQPPEGPFSPAQWEAEDRADRQGGLDGQVRSRPKLGRLFSFPHRPRYPPRLGFLPISDGAPPRSKP